MKLKSLVFATSSLVLSSSLLLSCSKTKGPESALPQDESTSEASSSESAMDTLPEKQQLSLETVYFDFDKYNIREDQVGRAMMAVKTIKEFPEQRVRIEGHTDDRGSADYNLALGQRRADAVKEFLVVQGVQKNLVTTTSFGKEKPAVKGENEQAWAQNRRAEFKVSD